MPQEAQAPDAGTAEGKAQALARRYTPDKTRCIVTFWLPRDAAPEAAQVVLVGSFNDWGLDRHPMKRLGNGDFSLDLELPAGQEHAFRFVVDGVRWENAWNADKYVWCDYAQCENSVVVT